MSRNADKTGHNVRFLLAFYRLEVLIQTLYQHIAKNFNCILILRLYQISNILKQLQGKFWHSVVFLQRFNEEKESIFPFNLYESLFKKIFLFLISMKSPKL